MGKKSTKRRTRWRTLSITDSGDEAAAVSPANNRRSSEVAAAVNHSNAGEVSSKDDTYRHPNTSYLRRKPLYDSSANIRSGYSRSYYKQQSGGFSSRAPYYRRPFQNGSSRFFNYRTGAQNNHRSADGNKEYNQARPIINEEEYTRITTPRQDVIFKKGYLSQPRKYLSSTDTNTTSSAAASVVSTEESISAASVPSLSPEQCSSYAESIDPEQAFMYSYFDQNGVFYFNPYLPNGFDQYASQMFMLPYSYQPYNVYPSDVNSPPQSTDIDENPTSTDSNENLSDNKETHTQGMTPESPIDCDEKTDPPTSEKTTETPEKSEKSSEDVTPHTEQNEATTNQMENFYNYGYQQFYPQLFFPYMYGQQFMPMIDHEPYTEYSNEGDERGATFKNRRNTRPQDDGSSTGVTTTDCSEEDYSDKENISDNVEIIHTDKNTTVTASENLESTEEIKKVIFNADVKEFIPRQLKPHLNVNVKEFLPKNYKPKRSTTSIEGNEKTVTVEEVNEDLPKPQRKPIKNDKGSLKVAEQISNSMEDTPDTSTSVANVEPVIPNLPTKPIQETPKLTLAERIKRDFAKDSTDTEQPSPPKNNSLNLVSKKSLKKNEIIKTPIVKEVRGMTFAKILTKDRPKPVKSQGKSCSGVNISNKPEKLPAKEVVKELQKQPEPIKVQSDPTAAKQEIVQDEWQTVKPKGKRSRHFVKEVAMFEELPIEKEALDQKVPDEIVHKEEIVKTSCEVPEVIVNEKCEDKIEKDVIVKGDEPKDNSDEKSPNSSIIKNSDVQSSQKKNKFRNKKTKKNPSPLKKTKEKEILRTSNEGKEEKTDQLVEDIVPQKDDALLGTPSTKKGDQLLDNLYLMDRNNSLLSKRFCRNPLEILNGFDCKFKANKSILKEEEDMVLNVIKSLSTSQIKTLEIKSPKSAEQAEELNEKTAPTTINEEQAETSCSIKKTVEKSEVPNELQDGTENPISNGISNDYEISEDAEEDTIVQEVPQEMQNSIGDKLSDTGSLSDLSVEDFEKKGDIKDCLFQAGVIDEEVCLKITYLDRRNEQNELEIKNVSQDEEEKKQESTIEDHQEELNCQSSHNSLEGNNMLLANVPKELTDGHQNESCDLFSHYSLEERILLEDNIQANPLIVKTNETPNEENLFLETPINGESNGIAFEDDLVFETAINVGPNKSTIDKDLLPEIETILKGESNDTAADKDLVLEITFNGEVAKTTIDESLVLQTAVEAATNKNTKETNAPEMKKSTVDEALLKGISLKSTEIGNKVDELLPQEIAIEKTHDTIDAKNEDPFFDIESFKPFKYNSEHTVDIQAVFEQKMKETDEEFKDKYNTIPQNSEGVKNPLDEEKDVLRENNNCLPKEVPSVKINLTESQAPEKEIIPQCELSVAGQRNENKLEDSEKNATIALLASLLEEVETHNLEVEKSPPLSALEGKDVVPTAYLSGDPPPIGEKVCESSSSNSIFLESPFGKLSSTTVVIEDYNSESCVESNTADNCPKITADNLLDIKTDLVINAALNEDDLCLECISLTNDSGIISSPTSFCQLSSETHDSNKTNFSTINIPALDEDPSKYPLTMAVREWLNQEAKEKTPEPIFRIPDNPKLSSIITSSMIEQTDRRSGDFDEWTSDESDFEDQAQVKPKNLLSNPSRVSSVNFMSNDNDSDYNSDSQQRFDDDDNTRERVAAITSDIDRRVKGDLFDYWNDEFVRDPKKWLSVSSCTNDDKESVFSTTPSEPMTPYESLYGKTIDYDRLLASNYEFLSNNIISFNDTSTAGDKHEQTDESRLNNNNINNNDNFGTNINGNHNCLKPPEVCCMIM